MPAAVPTKQATGRDKNTRPEMEPNSEDEMNDGTKLQPGKEPEAEMDSKTDVQPGEEPETQREVQDTSQALEPRAAQHSQSL